MTDQKELNTHELDQVVGGAGYTMNRGWIWVEEEECIACGCCESECPTGAIRERGSVYQVDPDECIGCMTCMDACPTGAIREN